MLLSAVQIELFGQVVRLETSNRFYLLQSPFFVFVLSRISRRLVAWLRGCVVEWLVEFLLSLPLNANAAEIIKSEDSCRTKIGWWSRVGGWWFRSRSTKNWNSLLLEDFGKIFLGFIFGGISLPRQMHSYCRNQLL